MKIVGTIKGNAIECEKRGQFFTCNGNSSNDRVKVDSVQTNGINSTWVYTDGLLTMDSPKIIKCVVDEYEEQEGPTGPKITKHTLHCNE